MKKEKSNQEKICIANIKNPVAAQFLGGPPPDQSVNILINKYNYTEQQIKKITGSK